MRGSATRQGRTAFGLTVAACLWAVGLILAALTVPVYGSSYGSSSGSGTGSGSATLAAVNGSGALIAVGLPALVTVLVWWALHRRCARSNRWGGPVAWLLIGLLGAYALAGAFSIGLYVLPIALLLGRAASLTPAGPPLT